MSSGFNEESDDDGDSSFGTLKRNVKQLYSNVSTRDYEIQNDSANSRKIGKYLFLAQETLPIGLVNLALSCHTNVLIQIFIHLPEVLKTVAIFSLDSTVTFSNDLEIKVSAPRAGESLSRSFFNLARSYLALAYKDLIGSEDKKSFKSLIKVSKFRG